MRVIFTPEAFNQTAGGISRIFAELATGLTERGERAELVAGLYINRYIRNLPQVKGRYTPRFPRPARAVLNTAYCHFAIARTPGAIVHQTYYSRHRYSQKHPLVVAVFDMIHELFPALLAPSGTVRKTIADKAFCCARADHICAISHQTKRDLVRILKVDESKVSVTSLGNALRDVRPTEIGRDEEKMYLLYVGGRRWYKNFGMLLRAFASSDTLKSDYRLICFGGGPFWPDELDLIQRLGLERQVHLRGGDDRLLAGYYRHAAAHISASLYEGFGLTLIEAMGAGCPVICSDRGSFPEIAGVAAVYFNPDDKTDVREKLEQVLCNPAKRAELRAAGLEREALYTWERCVSETTSVYQKVV